MYLFSRQAGLCNAALNSAEAAGASEHYANGTMVDYETLPNAIVPLLEQHFHVPLAPDEEAYALEVFYPLSAIASKIRKVGRSDILSLPQCIGVGRCELAVQERVHNFQEGRTQDVCHLSKFTSCTDGVRRFRICSSPEGKMLSYKNRGLGSGLTSWYVTWPKSPSLPTASP